MEFLVKLCNIMLIVTGVVAIVALTMTLSAAWLVYVPVIGPMSNYASTILWRSLGSMFWWVIARWFFNKLAGGDKRRIDD